MCIDIDGLEDQEAVTNNTDEAKGVPTIILATTAETAAAAEAATAAGTSLGAVEAVPWWAPIAAPAILVVGLVLIPLNWDKPAYDEITDYSTWAPPDYSPVSYTPQVESNPLPEPKVEPIAAPAPEPAPLPDNWDEEEPSKKKKFWVTYTKTKVNEKGKTIVYSGRTSGYYTGLAPTEADVDKALAKREAGQKVLRQEGGYGKATVDKVSTEYDEIRDREQQLIDFHGGAQSEGGTSRNKIRGIARNRPEYKEYMSAAILKWSEIPNNNPADQKVKE
jgi:hypothetical protein